MPSQDPSTQAQAFNWRRVWTLGALGGLGAIAISLFLAHAANLRAGKHELIFCLILTLYAALGGVVSASRPLGRRGDSQGFFSWRERGISLAASLLGAVVCATIFIRGGSLEFALHGLLRLAQSALVGGGLGRLVWVLVRDRWLAAFLAAGIFLSVSTLALWADSLITEGALSAEFVGEVGITNSPALRWLMAGLELEVFGDLLYLEQGFLMKDYTPGLYYHGVGWSWWIGLGALALSFGVEWLRSTLRKAHQARKLRRLGLEPEQDNEQSDI